MAAIAEKRQAVCPYLPPEIWQRIFFQHTDPYSLWTTGRKVCSTWRAGIPKVFAKKYLENNDMVQIYFDLGQRPVEGMLTDLTYVEMVFNRYEEKTKDRCVFVATPGMIWPQYPVFPTNFNQSVERERFAEWQRKLDLYLGVDAEARAKGGRFDLAPYQIRIKGVTNDTELPKLDEQARELSRSDKTTARWMKSGARKRSRAARQSVAKSIRRERVKKWYLENHGRKFDATLFDDAREKKVIIAIENQNSDGDFERCAGNAEELRIAASVWEYRDVYSELDEEDEMYKALFGTMSDENLDERDFLSDDESEEEWPGYEWHLDLGNDDLLF